MSDNLVMELLRAIRADIAKLGFRLDEHGHRLSRIELMVAGHRREQAIDAETTAHLPVRVDQIVERLDHMERRMDILPAQ